MYIWMCWHFICSNRFDCQPVCSHKICSNFLCTPGRSASSRGLYKMRRHYSSLPRFIGVVYRCRRRLREQRRQRGPYRAPDRQKQWRQHAFSRNRQYMKGKMSHIANHCQEKSLMEYCDFLAYRPPIKPVTTYIGTTEFGR